MNIQLLSDLHLENNPGFTPQHAPGADLLVLAGDIGSYQRRRDGSPMPDPDWGLRRFADWPVPVVYVPGNHEYDGLDWDDTHARLREACERLGLIWLEREVHVTQLARADARGETFESLGYNPPTFFLAPDVAAAKALNRQWPVDRMVEWSRTPGRGPAPDSGCVRWGLCEGTQGELFGEGP